MAGRFGRIVPFDGAAHGEALWSAFGGAALNGRISYFGWPDLASADDLVARLELMNTSGGWSTGTMLVDDRPVGFASYMREDADHGVVEIGGIAHAEAMARTPWSTEAHWLLMRHAFSLGYRRYEWKCDAANAASRRAAARLGFVAEGVFRQHMVTARGRNRDTAWFSVTDGEWPLLRAAFEAWLAPVNFDADGRQVRSLEAVRAGLAGG